MNGRFQVEPIQHTSASRKGKGDLPNTLQESRDAKRPKTDRSIQNSRFQPFGKSIKKVCVCPSVSAKKMRRQPGIKISDPKTSTETQRSHEHLSQIPSADSVSIGSGDCTSRSDPKQVSAGPPPPPEELIRLEPSKDSHCPTCVRPPSKLRKSRLDISLIGLRLEYHRP